MIQIQNDKSILSKIFDFLKIQNIYLFGFESFVEAIVVVNSMLIYVLLLNKDFSFDIVHEFNSFVCCK